MLFLQGSKITSDTTLFVGDRLGAMANSVTQLHQDYIVAKGNIASPVRQDLTSRPPLKGIIPPSAYCNLFIAIL